jgi:hypothetical protein
MQHTALHAQAQGQGKRSPAVIGIGAALVASAVTFVIVSSNHSPAVSGTDQEISATKQCQMMPRRLLVSTTHGGGTVRFRASGYLSPPFTLTREPQVVQFPLPRPDSTPVNEPISVEGNATDVVITSEVTDLHQVFDLMGSYTYTVTWKPMKSC